MKILLGMPCMKTIPYRTVMSLLRTVKKGAVEPMVVEGSLVYDARDTIARYAIDNGYDYVLYADSDMEFDKPDIDRLLAHNVDICSGLYVTRDGKNNNVAYSEIITRRFRRLPKLITDNTSAGYGSVAAVGFGFCLIKTSVLESMFKHYKSIFEPKWGVGEDVAFCIRAKKCGYCINIDRDIKLGHIGDMVYK